MKIFIYTMLAVTVILIGVVIGYRWDSGKNHGYQFGYYGEFNRVSNALASIPGITITQSWHHCDVTLEEFGFKATVGSGEPIRIWVGEHDRIRSLSGDALVQALQTEIQRQAQTK